MKVADLKVERIVIQAHINTLVSYYEKRLPEIEQEYEKATKEGASIAASIGSLAGSYKACSEAMLLELKEIKQRLDKINKYDKTK
jgi:hypothetical protein